MTDAKRPILKLPDLYWHVYDCPCGLDLHTRFASAAEFDRWLAAHRPHSNGSVWVPDERRDAMGVPPPGAASRLVLGHLDVI